MTAVETPTLPPAFVALPGALTTMKCPCGGELQEYRTVPKATSAPRHRKRRINKKWEKRWREQERERLGLLGVIALISPPYFRCVSCGRRTGFYTTLGRNMFHVEPLPEEGSPGVARDPSTTDP